MIAVRGVLKNGKVELLDPIRAKGEFPVIVTVLDDRAPYDAAELTATSAPLRACWDDPALDVYNDAPAR